MLVKSMLKHICCFICCIDHSSFINNPHEMNKLQHLSHIMETKIIIDIRLSANKTVIWKTH